MQQAVPQVWIASSIALGCLVTVSSVRAQIIPDNTLRVNSRVAPGCTVCTIEGGTVRGVNLFHSFREFSVHTGGEAFFNNAAAIQNIFSRVTGSNLSNIDGLIRANGTANLFLLNPNGIIFGPNAQLNIGGSFLASTATRFTFADGSVFSTTHPQAPPLLRVNLTPGLQWGASQPSGRITNAGNLAVGEGQTLTLFGSTVTSTGSLTAPGGTVRVLGQRVGLFNNALVDVSSDRGGGTVLIGGDFQGKGEVPNARRTFVDAGVSINADALRTDNGGKVIVWADEVTGFYGNISARGGSEAGKGGFVEVSGKQNLIFRGTVDTSAARGNAGTLLLDPENISIVNGDGPANDDQVTDAQILAGDGFGSTSTISQKALEGLSATANVILQATNDITINDLADNQLTFAAGSGGSIRFKADADGDHVGSFSMDTTDTIRAEARDVRISGASVTVGNINTSTNTPGINGGAISLRALSGDIFTGNLNSMSSANRGNAGNGGNIHLEASNGNITTSGDLSSFSESSRRTAGNGGNIRVEASNGNITTSGDLNSSSYSDSGSGGNGGNIHLGASNGNITTSGYWDSSSYSDSGSGGNGGNIYLGANNGNIITSGYWDSYSYSFKSTVGNGGNIRLEASNGNIISSGDLDSSSGSFKGTAGNGGNIRLEASNGNITTSGDLFSYSHSNSGTAGNGGNIRLEASNGNITTSGYLGSSSDSDSGTAGNAGNIRLEADNVNITTEAFLDSSSDSDSGTAGNGGNIRLEASNGNITTSGYLGSSSYSNSGIAGNAGNIRLEAGNVNITTEAYLDSSSYSDSGTAGNAGNIRLEASNGNITTEAFLDSSSESSKGTGGNGGTISITSSGTFSAKDSLIRTNASNGNGGNIQIWAASVSLTNTELTTTVAGMGNAGSISITVDSLLALDSTRLFTSLEPGGMGRGGDITIDGGAVSLTRASFIDTATFGQGDAGNVKIEANDSVLLDNNSAIFSITSGQGNGGNVTVKAGGAVSLANGSNISTAVNSRAVGNGGNITIEARTLFLTGGSQLVTNTSSSGRAGDITVKATEGVFIWGVDPNFTPSPNVDIPVKHPTTLDEATAKAQNINNFLSLDGSNNVNPNVEFSTTIPYVSISGMADDTSTNDYYTFEVTTAGTRAIFDIDTLVPGGTNTGLFLLKDGKQLVSNSSASRSLGAGGSITNDPYLRYVFSEPGTYSIRVKSYEPGSYILQVSLETPNVARSVVNGVLPSGVFARSQGTGVAGNVTTNTPQLTVKEGGQVSAETTGAGAAGDVRLQPYDNGKTLTVNLQDNARISASTSGIGRGGSLSVTAPEAVTLTGNGQLSVETSGAGKAGDVIITTETLNVESGAKVSATATDTATSSAQGGSISVNASVVNLSGTGGGLFAETQGVAPAGTLTLQSYNNGQTLAVNFQDGAKISTSTSGRGRGGNLSVTAPEAVRLTGNGQLLAQSTGAGAGGNLTINTGQLTVSNGAEAAVSGKDIGNGGTLNVSANSVLLDNQAKLTAETAAAEGGNINLQVQDQLRLRNGSKLSAQASGNANGGNINIDTGFIIALPPEGSNGSDIIASASQGNGGRISIIAQGIFRLEQRKAIPGNGTNDIDASSEFGTAGQVQIKTFVDPNQGLTELPSELVDRTRQIDQRCAAKGESMNKFIVTGRGGLPPSPDDILQGESVVVNWVTLDPQTDNSSRNVTSANPARSAPTATTAPQTRAITEAQGWAYGPNGEVILTAEASNVTPHSPILTPAPCRRTPIQ
jgi:filamentous hemagglutinin family protein